MKRGIIIAIIIILSITTCISTGIVIYQMQNYIKIPVQYRCETEEQKLDNMSYKQIMIININKEQYIENYQSKNINIFLEQEQYDLAKSVENTDDVTYSFNDDKKTMLIDYGITAIKNDNGETINIWYKDYIKNLETAGFSCKIVK